MRKHRIATVINFCTNEAKFLRHTFEEALKFSSEVIAVASSHFFDGSEENRSLLNQIYASFPKVLFVEYPYNPSLVPKRIFQVLKPTTFWHCFSRLVGFSMLSDSIDWVLFLDADEVPDGNRFSEWLDFSGYRCYTALKMANYWYFREPIYQAKTWEDSIVFLSKKAILPETLIDPQERDALYNLLPSPKRRMVIGPDGKPMFHHFSWVREKEEMIKKVETWGHRQDRDWKLLIEKEFSSSFSGTDFVHGYQFSEVSSPFSFDETFSQNKTPQVHKLSEKEALRLAKMKKVPFSWAHFLTNFSSLKS